ncbi:MAG: M56 family metallopeptidase [Gemmatimonadota bacterium]
MLLIKAALILSCAWLVTRLSWRASAAVRHGTWSLAVLAALSLPLTSAWIPPLTVPVPEPLQLTEVRPSPAPSLSGDSPAAVEFPSARARVWQTVRSGAAVPAPDAHRGDAWLQMNWPALLVVLWLAGVVLRMSWLGVLFIRTRGMIRGARPLTGGSAGPIAREFAALLGISRHIRVLETDRVSMPLAWGLLRPVIVLPRGIEEWPEERLRIVLLHELAHIRRWDFFTSLAAEIACAAYWPVPLVWLARRQIRFEQEQACDDRVLEIGTAAVVYAEHLLAVARAFYGRRWELGMVVTMAREVTLKHRVRAILDERTNRRPLRSPAGAAVSVALLILFLPVAALRGGSETEIDDGSDGERAAAANAAELVSLAAAIPVEIQEDAVATLWIEAESGRALGRSALRQDLDASEAGYVLLRDPNRRNPEAGEVDVTFQVPADGEYAIWARVIGDRRGDAVLRASVGAAGQAIWYVRDRDGRGIRNWRWIPMSSANAGEAGRPMRLSLTAGEHTLRVSAAEDDVLLDRVLVTDDHGLTPNGRGPTAEGFRPTYHVLEAELGQVTGRVSQRSDEYASAGEYLVFRSDRRGREAGSVAFAVDVDQPGRYLIWGRVLAPSDDANSFYVSIDDGPEVVWDAPERRVDRDDRTWTWDPVSARDLDGQTMDPLILDLGAGRHTVEVRTREGGARLDAMLVTNDLTQKPEGIWPSTLPVSPVQVTLEAEAASLSPPLMVQPHPAPEMGAFVQVGDDLRRARPGSGGVARLDFRVPDAGIYSMWGRTIAPSDDQNSFWVRVDGGDWVRWNGIPRSEDWVWSAVRDADEANYLAQFELEPGEHTVEIGGREGGVMLDKVILSNDPLFRPE